MAASKKKGQKVQAMGMRNKAVKVQGKYLPSVMLRVDLDFANYVRAEAKRHTTTDHKVTATEVTRLIYEGLLNERGAA